MGRILPPHIQFTSAVFETADKCRRENIALRSILRKMGLSDRAIQSRVRRILKKPDQDETGAQAVKRACEENIKQLLDLEAQEGIAKLDLKGHPIQ
jgi:chaperonin GroEL (HSP60 family)